MTTKTFDELPESEQKSFLSACHDAHLVPEAFNVSFAEETAGEEGVEPYDRSVIVQWGVIARAYNGSFGADWTVDFAEDIWAGVFT